MATFSIKEALRRAWKLCKENILVLIGLTSVIGLISWILEIWSRGMGRAYSSGHFGIFSVFLAAYLLTLVVSMLAQIGYTKILFKVYDGEEIGPGDIFGYYDRLWKFIVLSFLYGFIVLLGAVFLIVPGIIFAIKYGYGSYFVIDKNMRPVQALKESAKITSGQKWKLAGFGVIIIGVNILGASLFGIGFLFTMPFSVLASIHVFRILCQDMKSQQELPLDGKNEPSE